MLTRGAREGLITLTQPGGEQKVGRSVGRSLQSQHSFADACQGRPEVLTAPQARDPGHVVGDAQRGMYSDRGLGAVQLRVAHSQQMDPLADVVPLRLPGGEAIVLGDLVDLGDHQTDEVMVDLGEVDVRANQHRERLGGG